MATPAEIIAAIDTAIASWVGSPVTINEQGNSVTYRSLKELMAARHYYAQLDATSSTSRHGFRLTHIKAGGATT